MQNHQKADAKVSEISVSVLSGKSNKICNLSTGHLIL